MLQPHWSLCLSLHKPGRVLASGLLYLLLPSARRTLSPDGLAGFLLPSEARASAALGLKIHPSPWHVMFPFFLFSSKYSACHCLRVPYVLLIVCVTCLPTLEGQLREVGDFCCILFAALFLPSGTVPGSSELLGK